MRYPDGGGLTAKQRAQREQVRFEAAELFAQGVLPPQIARRLRVSRKSAYAWHARWREGGAEALRSKGPPGQPSRMKPGWREWLALELEKGPAAHGWVEDQRWTLDRISTVIARHFHVRFSPAQTWRIMHQMGWTVQVPARRAAERDEDAVTGWIKDTLATGGKTVRDQDAWLCFADESGQMLRPPKARTWSPRGHTPCVSVRAAGSGRISLAGVVCRKAGRRTRLIFRVLVHHGRKGEKKGFRERDFASLLDAAHQQLGGNIVLVWDNYSHHVDATMRELIGKRPWLTVFRFPTYSPDLNPAEGAWAHLKNSLGNLAPCSIDDLAGLVGTRLKRMQYRHDLLDGFIAGTRLITTPP